uniref:Fibronectin type-III domain-containing protein n=1 Tax=Hanusia phi TaxID=3032 RepID=A0A7S0EE32_9CRYP|mmetsp:Transcript_22619/g.50955  ORF Transcript_22619/g.50955 Transcript_22619/m.50955 type:complete len:899 (+) Transcript_22619:153-2849(+)
MIRLSTFGLVGLVVLAQASANPACYTLGLVDTATVNRKQGFPDKFETQNYNSPDLSVKFVMDYSVDHTFNNLNISESAIPEQYYFRYYLTPEGEDLGVAVLDSEGYTLGGRYIYTKTIWPEQSFIFPVHRRLRPGLTYYFRNYRVRNDCMYPSWAWQRYYPEDVLTSPSKEVVYGLPSPVTAIQVVLLDQSKTILVSWPLPTDTGNELPADNNRSIPVKYYVELTEVNTTANSTLRILNSTWLNFTTQVNLTESSLVIGILYNISLRVENEIGLSTATTRYLRPATNPSVPDSFQAALNPSDVTNVSGNMFAVLSWKDPIDKGLGLPCLSTSYSPCDEFPIHIVNYSLSLSGEPNVVLDGTTKSFDVIFSADSLVSKLQDTSLAAQNYQEERFGYYSAYGEASTLHKSYPLPPPMRIGYFEPCFPYCSNASKNQINFVSPPNARGISDYCYPCDGCRFDSQTACPSSWNFNITASFNPFEQCGSDIQPCKNPVVEIYPVNSSQIKIQAIWLDPTTKDSSTLSQMYANSRVVFGKNITFEYEKDFESVLAPWKNWRDYIDVTRTETGFFCNGSYSDPEGCSHLNNNAQLYYGSMQNATDLRMFEYGWSEIVVKVTFQEGLLSLQQDPTLCVTAIGDFNSRSKLCFVLKTIRSNPNFVTPSFSQDLNIGCEFSKVFEAQDKTEANLDIAEARRMKYFVKIVSGGGYVQSVYRNSSFSHLPRGASLMPYGDVVTNPVSYRLQWTPERHQEGYTYVVTLEAIGYINGSNVPMVSSSNSMLTVRLTVLRCKMCVNNVSLELIAQEWRTSWLNIWSGNHMLWQQNDISLGPVFTVDCGNGYYCDDDLYHIGERYGVSVSDLLWWNPDIADDAGRSAKYALKTGQEICVLPNTCLTSGHIFSAGY